MTAKTKPEWAQSEAALVQEFCDRVDRSYSRKRWTIYPETAGWDLLLVHSDGFQLGVEAKLTLNAKVIDQSLDRQHARYNHDGPDFRAVLVPTVGLQHHLERICAAIGINIIALRDDRYGAKYVNLPINYDEHNWHNWCPAIRCPVPDYIPDVRAGVAAPVKLTEWKIKAIKLMIVLERKGWVDRSDMRAIGISPSRWTDCYNGFLARGGAGQYVRFEGTPDYRVQHPDNYAQIEADAAKWGTCFDPFKQVAPEWLVGKEAA